MTSPAPAGLRALQAAEASPDLPAAPVSAERARFDQLLRQLERQRAELQAWEQAMPRWHRRYVEQLLPLLEQRSAHERALVEALDQVHGGPELGRSERALVSARIAELAAWLAADGDDAFTALLARHAAPVGIEDAPDDATPAADEHDDARLRQAVAELYGVSVDELDAYEVPDDVYAQVRARLEQAQTHLQGRREGRGRRAQAPLQHEPPPLRTVFRRLAASLHPDRARDAEDAQRRTALMQKLNAANRDGDMIGMLELQAQLGQLDAAGVDAMGEVRLQQYNRTLEAQAVQLREQLAQAIARFGTDYGLDLPVPPRVDELDRLMARLKRGVAAESEALLHERHALHDPRTLRDYLRELRRYDG